MKLVEDVFPSTMSVESSRKQWEHRMNTPDTDYRSATIISSWRENMIIVKDSDGRRFAFELTMIEGYRGESAQELKLVVGKEVKIKTDDRIVSSVKL